MLWALWHAEYWLQFILVSFRDEFTFQSIKTRSLNPHYWPLLFYWVHSVKVKSTSCQTSPGVSEGVCRVMGLKKCPSHQSRWINVLPEVREISDTPAEACRNPASPHSPDICGWSHHCRGHGPEEEPRHERDSGLRWMRRRCNSSPGVLHLTRIRPDDL